MIKTNTDLDNIFEFLGKIFKFLSSMFDNIAEGFAKSLVKQESEDYYYGEI